METNRTTSFPAARMLLINSIHLTIGAIFLSVSILISSDSPLWLWILTGGIMILQIGSIVAQVRAMRASKRRKETDESAAFDMQHIT